MSAGPGCVTHLGRFTQPQTVWVLAPALSTPLADVAHDRLASGPGNGPSLQEIVRRSPLLVSVS